MRRTFALFLTAALVALAGAGPSRPPMPPIDKPVLFDTPEADKMLEALQVFPPDNPWNQDISQWPVHRTPGNIIAAIGADKPFRDNTDMGFVLVPPDQKRFRVAITTYADESDKGPFPVPDNLPIEGWPVNYQGKRSRSTTCSATSSAKAATGTASWSIRVRGMLYEFYQMRKTDAAGRRRRPRSSI